jgi:predicted PurR-regulated permease PerM
MVMMSKLTNKQIIIFSVLLFVLIYVTVHTDAIGHFFTVLRPFINGFILAYLTEILVSRVEKKIPLKSARGLSILIVYLLFASALTLLLVYMIPILIQNVQVFIRKLPDYLMQSRFPNMDHLLGSFSLFDLSSRLTNGLLGFTGYARAATSGVVNMVLSFVVSVYVLLTKDAIFRFNNRLAKIIMPNYADALQRHLNKSHLVFQTFLLAQLLASLILGLLAGLILSLVGVNYAILIGTIVGLFNIIPLFGAIMGVFISVVIMFLTNPPMLALASFVFLLLLQQIDATIITPKLMGNALNLNPIIIILVLVLGTTYFGFIGILFAVPVTVMIREIVKEKLRE